jgi:hypothetical protein
MMGRDEVGEFFHDSKLGDVVRVYDARYVIVAKNKELSVYIATRDDSMFLVQDRDKITCTRVGHESRGNEVKREDGEWRLNS